MTIEADDNRSYPCVPDPNSPITIPVILGQRLAVHMNARWAHPTANTSRSALLWEIVVTSATQSLSLHRLKSSPFFTSQHMTSSSAPTTAFPTFDWRRAAFWKSSSGAQRTLDVEEVMRPKVLECSYFLPPLVLNLVLEARRQDALTSMT